MTYKKLLGTYSLDFLGSMFEALWQQVNHNQLY